MAAFVVFISNAWSFYDKTDRFVAALNEAIKNNQTDETTKGTIRAQFALLTGVQTELNYLVMVLLIGGGGFFLIGYRNWIRKQK